MFLVLVYHILWSKSTTKTNFLKFVEIEWKITDCLCNLLLIFVEICAIICLVKSKRAFCWTSKIRQKLTVVQRRVTIRQNFVKVCFACVQTETKGQILCKSVILLWKGSLSPKKVTEALQVLQFVTIQKKTGAGVF